MLSTPHVAVGAAIGVSFVNPAVSIPLAVGAHFLLDMVPHWNPHLNTDLRQYGKVSSRNTVIVLLDTITALTLGLFIAFSFSTSQSHQIAIILTCFASVLPDLVEAPHYFVGFRNKLVTKYIKWQKSIQNDVPPSLGILIQIVVILASLWIVTN